MMLAALKNRFKSAKDLSLWTGPGDDVIALHGPDGRFMQLSEGALEIFGIAPRKLVGKRLMDVIAPAHQGRLLTALAQVGAPGGRGQARFDARVRVGEDLGGHVEIALSRTTDGMLRSVTRSIEDRVAREDEVREEGRRLIAEASRRNDHLANVSHEIRTPLNAVIGFAEAISAERFGPMGNDRYRDYAKVIHDSGEHLLALISDLLDLSKAEANATALTKTLTAPGELVELCAEIMSLRAEEAGLEVKTEVKPDIEEVLLDAKVVRQIILNLLSNALKFTEEGGITIGLHQDRQSLVFSVKDTGVGMAPDELALVGERFRQARSEGVRGTRGSGLGLSLSKALARVHGGELTLTSTVGEGTTALLRLPIERAAEETPSNVTMLSDIRRA